jgi:N-acetylneuraminate synthase
MGRFNRPLIIAEIGCNHRGEFETAKKMIDVAADFCGADIVKFQKRCNRELLSEEEYNTPYPVPYNSYGTTYGEHREFLEFTKNQHKVLKKYCDRKKIVYSTSVWDLTSAIEITSLKPQMIKIPSATNLNFPVLEYLCKKFDGEIHVSLGMTTQKEEEEIVDFFIQQGRNEDLIIYACTSGYPVPFEDLCLLEIDRLQSTFESSVKSIGFSGHQYGIAADIAVMTLGVSHIERHFTLDRTWKGTDHAASLEPGGMRKMIRDIAAVNSALTYKKDEILPIEEVQRKKLKKVIR